MKIKNSQLLPTAQGVLLISNLKMPGVVSLAVHKGVKQVTDTYNTYSEARKQIIEARCKKDENGKPVIVDADDKGNVLTEETKKTYTGEVSQIYSFESDEIEKETMAEAKVIDDKENDFVFDVVDDKILHGIECTLAQMKVIKSLID